MSFWPILISINDSIGANSEAPILRGNAPRACFTFYCLYNIFANSRNVFLSIYRTEKTYPLTDGHTHR